MTHHKHALRVLPLAMATAVAIATLAPGMASAQQASDPLFKHQWHLRNIGQVAPADTKPKYGIDLGVDDLHRHNIRGQGVTIAIVDDGLQIGHPDIAPNVGAIGGKNFINQSNDPSPANPGNDNHGTMVGGIAGAAGFNGVGVRGVAPSATLKGFGFLEGGGVVATTANMQYSWWEGAETRDVDVFNNSWGSSAATRIMPLAISDELRSSFENGMYSTRGGLGGVYIKSAGNAFAQGAVSFLGSRFNVCDANSVTFGVGCIPNTWDTRNNLFGVMVIGAVRADGKRSSYSSAGSATWVSAFGGEYGLQRRFVPEAQINPAYLPDVYDPAIVTTDVMGCDAGSNSNGSVENVLDGSQSTIDTTCNYTAKMNGTSASAPMASGVAALVLEANPRLTYRDVRYILATTARRNHPDLPAGRHTDGRVLMPGWTVNAAGHAYSNWYGYGLVDAAAAVIKAADFKSLPALVDTGWRETTAEAPIAIGGTEATAARITLNVAGGPRRIEGVQLGFRVNHSSTRHLQFVLISPSGTRNVVQPAFTSIGYGVTLTASGFARSISNFSNWELLSSNAFLDENGSGNWVLEVTDMNLAADAASRGNLEFLKLRVLGN